MKRITMMQDQADEPLSPRFRSRIAPLIRRDQEGLAVASSHNQKQSKIGGYRAKLPALARVDHLQRVVTFSVVV